MTRTKKSNLRKLTKHWKLMLRLIFPLCLIGIFIKLIIEYIEIGTSVGIIFPLVSILVILAWCAYDIWSTLKEQKFQKMPPFEG